MTIWKSLRAACAASALVIAPLGHAAQAQEVAASDTRSKIVGGIPAPQGLLAWQVSMFRVADGHFCGGSLIAENWVLTAAHCVFREQANAPTFRVLLGTNDLLMGGVVRDVERIIVHDAYKPQLTGEANDIALLQLAPLAPGQGRSLSPIKTISPFATPNSSAREVTGNVVVSGFGLTEESGQSSAKLLMAEIPIVANTACNAPESYDGAILDTMLCAGKPGVDSCQGDSGGPLVMGNRTRGYALVGVVSWGDGCARPQKYGVYTRVASYEDWIRKNAGL